jgi:SpoVK/Ycf46/Vps4 family AAA+-type ATPase
VIGATNRPDLLEPALLRFGRFDRKIFVGFSEDIPSKLSILKAQTKKFAFQDDFNLEEIALLLPKSVSGADISALCRSAYLIALDRTLVQFKEQALNHPVNSSSKLESSISEEEMNEITALYMDSLPQNDLIVKVKYPDFTSAIENFIPSLSEAELNEYKAMNTSIDNDYIASYGEKSIHSDVNSQIEILM